MPSRRRLFWSIGICLVGWLWSIWPPRPHMTIPYDSDSSEIAGFTDANRLVLLNTRDWSINTLDSHTGQLLKSVSIKFPQKTGLHDGHVHGIEMSPNGRWLTYTMMDDDDRCHDTVFVDAQTSHATVTHFDRCIPSDILVLDTPSHDGRLICRHFMCNWSGDNDRGEYYVIDAQTNEVLFCGEGTPILERNGGRMAVYDFRPDTMHRIHIRRLNDGAYLDSIDLPLQASSFDESFHAFESDSLCIRGVRDSRRWYSATSKKVQPISEDWLRYWPGTLNLPTVSEAIQKDHVILSHEKTNGRVTELWNDGARRFKLWPEMSPPMIQELRRFSRTDQSLDAAVPVSSFSGQYQVSQDATLAWTLNFDTEPAQLEVWDLTRRRSWFQSPILIAVVICLVCAIRNRWSSARKRTTDFRVGR